MASINEIIEINISRETRGVTRQGFGTPLFIGDTSGVLGLDDRVRTYTSAEAVLSDFSETDPEYIAAQRFFGQQISPTFIKIGLHDPTATQSVDFEVTPASSTTYEVTVDSTPFSYEAGDGDTVQDIVEGLQEDFAAQSVPGTFVDNNDGTFTIIPADKSEFSYSTASPELADTENLETITNAYDEIKDTDDDFYFVTAYSHTPVDIELLADVVQTEKRLYVTSYKGPDAVDATDSSDIGSTLKEKDLSRTMIIYAEDMSEYPECAFVGLQAPKDPGSTTWKFKTVSGVTVSNLTTTQSLTLKGTQFDYGKGYNTYESVGGRNILREGRVVNGEFIDQLVA